MENIDTHFKDPHSNKMHDLLLKKEVQISLHEEQNNTWNLGVSNTFDELNKTSGSDFEYFNIEKQDRDITIQDSHEFCPMKEFPPKIATQALKKKSLSYDLQKSIPTSLLGTENSDDSSGDLINKESLIIKSPINLHINLSNVVSHTDDSISNCSQLSFNSNGNLNNNTFLNNDYGSDNSYNSSKKNKCIHEYNYDSKISNEQLKIMHKARCCEIQSLKEELNQIKLLFKQELEMVKNKTVFISTNGDSVKSHVAIGTNLNDLQQKDKQIKNLRVENTELKLQLLECISKNCEIHKENISQIETFYYEEINSVKKFLSASKQIGELKELVKLLEDKLFAFSESIKVKERTKFIHSDPKPGNNLKKLKCHYSELIKRNLETHGIPHQLEISKSDCFPLEKFDDLILAISDESQTRSNVKKGITISNKNGNQSKNFNDKNNLEMIELLINSMHQDKINEGNLAKEKTNNTLECKLKILKEIFDHCKPFHTQEKYHNGNNEDLMDKIPYTDDQIYPDLIKTEHLNDYLRKSFNKTFEGLMVLYKEHLKSFPDSSDGRELKDLFNAFLLNDQQIKEEKERVVQENILLKNENQTLRFELEKNKSEHLKSKLSSLLSTMQKNKNFGEDCKDTLLTVGEDAFVKIIEELYNECNEIMVYLSKEMNKILNDLYKVRNTYSKVFSEEKLEQIFNTMIENKAILDRKRDYLYKNERCKQSLDEIKNKSLEEISQINKDLSLPFRKSNNSIVDFKSEEKNRNKMKSANETTTKINDDAKNIKNERETDLLFVYINDITEQYKHLSNELKKRMNNLKEFYEKQVQESTKVAKSCFPKANHLKIENIILNCQVENKKDKLVRMTKLYENHTKGLMAKLHKINEENFIYKKEIRLLREQVKSQMEKYSYLKKKCFRLKSNMHEYRIWGSSLLERFLYEEELKEKKQDKCKMGEKEFVELKTGLILSQEILKVTKD